MNRKNETIFKNELMWEEQQKKNHKPFYKSWKTYAIALGIIALGTGTGLGIYYGVTAKQETTAKITDENIVDVISTKTYKAETIAGSPVDSITDQIDAKFIQDELKKDEKIDTAFLPKLFTFNKITVDGNDLNVNDLKTARIIDAKITYDYDSLKNQETNLTIIVKSINGDLKDIFNDFVFTDQRNMKGFLDSNDQGIIEDLILDHLSETSLQEAGLVLENQTANSILLRANRADKYQGEVRLTWNLKLFELYGIEAWKYTDNEDFKKGLKGYFYLEADTNQIKYFDFAGKIFGDLTFHQSFNKYHSFSFDNKVDKVKKFTINGLWYPTKIENQFDSFNFGDGVEVKMSSPELYRIKMFNSENNQWKSVNGANNTEKTFFINPSGHIKEKE